MQFRPKHYFVIVNRSFHIFSETQNNLQLNVLFND